MKIFWENFCIETTRRCNMRCAHCMRGEPEDIDINIKWIEEIFKNTAYIGVLNFYGGEPTLNENILKQTLELAKKYNIIVLNLDIITNGKKITDNFINIINEWGRYCSLFNNNRQQDLYITIDPFHEEIDPKNITKIWNNCFSRIGLDLYKPEKTFVKNDSKNVKKTYIVDCGRARSLKGYKKLPWNVSKNQPLIYKYNENYYVKAKIALSCTGYILKHTVYEWISEDKVRLCYYTNLINTFEKIAIPSQPDINFFNVFKNGRDKW